MATRAPHDRRAAAEQSILRAAADLLDEGNAFATLSVEQIAGRAGIGRTAFYFYFRDKRELLLRLTEAVIDELYAEADRWWHGEAGLEDSLERVAGLYLEHGTLLRVVADTAAYDDDVRSRWIELVGRFVHATRERIAADQRAGSAAPVPPAETAMALIWMSERTLYHFSRTTPDADPARLTDALTQIFRRAIYGRLPDQAAVS